MFKTVSYSLILKNKNNQNQNNNQNQQALTFVVHIRPSTI